MRNIIKKILKESDFDWIRDVEPVCYHDCPSKGNKIRVISVGNWDAYKSWLGTYYHMYDDGRYGEYITGEVIAQYENDFVIKETMVGSTIYLPKVDENYTPIEENWKNSGLKLVYELI